MNGKRQKSSHPLCITCNSINKYQYFNTNYDRIIITSEKVTIADGGFSQCVQLHTVKLPPLCVMGIKVFINCISLQFINLDRLESIPDHAFEYCYNLKAVQLTSAQTVGYNAFAHCKSLATIDFGSTLSCISKRAFHNCESLQYVAFPASVVKIGKGAFMNCTSLGGLMFPALVTTVEEDAFRGCINIRRVEFCNVKTIKQNAFNNCKSLHKIQWMSVTKIGNNAFYNCALVDVDFPDRLEYIGQMAFMLNPLKTLVVPPGTTHVGKYAFSKCTKLDVVTFLSPNTHLQYNAFGKFDERLTYRYYNEPTRLINGYKYTVYEKYNRNQLLTDVRETDLDMSDNQDSKSFQIVLSTPNTSPTGVTSSLDLLYSVQTIITPFLSSPSICMLMCSHEFKTRTFDN